jgi:hypothetical protein
MARAGLEHHTGLMPVDSHPFERGRITVVQIQQDVASVPAFSIGLKVYVTALTIANAQESDCRFLAQLDGCPKLFTRERHSGGVVNQPNNRDHRAPPRVGVECRARGGTSHDQT